MVPEMVRASTTVAAVNLVPTDRHIALESRTYGWQRSDPLRGTFLALVNMPPGAMAAVALSLRALPSLGFALSLGVFAVGPAAPSHVARVASTLGGVGVRLRRPILQRRAARRMLRGALRRPASVRRVEAVARFWHPPYRLGRRPAVDGPGRHARRVPDQRTDPLTLPAQPPTVSPRPKGARTTESRGLRPLRVGLGRGMSGRGAHHESASPGRGALLQRGHRGRARSDGLPRAGGSTTDRNGLHPQARRAGRSPYSADDVSAVPVRAQEGDFNYEHRAPGQYGARYTQDLRANDILRDDDLVDAGAQVEIAVTVQAPPAINPATTSTSSPPSPAAARRASVRGSPSCPRREARSPSWCRSTRRRRGYRWRPRASHSTPRWQANSTASLQPLNPGDAVSRLCGAGCAGVPSPAGAP